MRADLVVRSPSLPPALPLPGVLAEIAEVAGSDAALKIAHAKGGTRVWIPMRLPSDHWLVVLVGLDHAKAIANKLSAGTVGMEHVIPMGPIRSRTATWRTMKHMKGEGASASVIARATGTHYKTVQRVLNNKRKTVDLVLRQHDLFESL
jgi:hypothetical protein